MNKQQIILMSSKLSAKEQKAISTMAEDIATEYDHMIDYLQKEIDGEYDHIREQVKKGHESDEGFIRSATKQIETYKRSVDELKRQTQQRYSDLEKVAIMLRSDK